MHRLINDFLQPPAPSPIVVRAMFAAKDGYEAGHVQSRRVRSISP